MIISFLSQVFYEVVCLCEGQKRRLSDVQGQRKSGLSSQS